MDSKTNVSSDQPVLCSKCHSFFANERFKGMCSVCFKETAKVEETSKNVEKPQTETKIQAPLKTSPSEVQANHEICFNCQKKVGIQGFLCKCSFTFCKKHRMPESHECAYDFKEEWKVQLSKLNPKLEEKKVEKID